MLIITQLSHICHCASCFDCISSMAEGNEVPNFLIQVDSDDKDSSLFLMQVVKDES